MYYARLVHSFVCFLVSTRRVKQSSISSNQPSRSQRNRHPEHMHAGSFSRHFAEYLKPLEGRDKKRWLFRLYQVQQQQVCTRMSADSLVFYSTSICFYRTAAAVFGEHGVVIDIAAATCQPSTAHGERLSIPISRRPRADVALPHGP